ncbi:MAG: hypothetical protein WAT12_11770, partial [Candidatus Nitrotoga sp.]
PVGVGGVSTENQNNRIKTEANALRKVYAKFRLRKLDRAREVKPRSNPFVGQTRYLCASWLSEKIYFWNYSGLKSFHEEEGWKTHF